jgi:prepilin-type N-terminal cleavage/methylation domain-containing protein/prepilin-type processing-associated H-X9-DG protein
MKSRHYRFAFSLIELLVVIGIIAVLMAILLPALERAREKANGTKCANSLRQIGLALSAYVNDNHGQYPRTVYKADAPYAKGTNPAAPDPFGPGGPATNDLTTPIYLLIITESLPAQMAGCPYDDVNDFQVDKLARLGRSNFTDYKKNLGYSFANPYPSTAASNAGYVLKSGAVNAEFAVAADLNPGKKAGSDVTAVTPNMTTNDLKKGLSRNHEGDGMNVLYGDGHVIWVQTPFCGVNQDNVFTNQANQIEASPVGKGDSVLLPTE